MNYRLLISARAVRMMKGLPLSVLERIDQAVSALAANPHPPGCKKLTNRVGWRIRVGEYRIMYDIDEKQRTVNVFAVGHRREVYR